MRKIILFVSLISFLSVHAQRKIDVLDCTYEITLNDQNDTIRGWARIEFAALEKLDSVTLDFANLAPSGKGMIVTRTMIIDPDHSVRFTHSGDKLKIPYKLKRGDTTEVIITYKGIPADGLIISKNKYGKKTFFSDNWPNRAHYWIPCIDDPMDKAKVNFEVIAPDHYKVVSNGILFREIKDENRQTKKTLWKENIPLPTKVMVIGVADFAIDSIGTVNGVPVSSWVFSDNAKAGFYDYASAKEILTFFVNYIGPYPYEKLANVQSKTIFGGMENASAIFYFENSVTGRGKDESLLSHEIVHQWFGDMATEKSFSHLWLSEGFATYLTHVYIESKYGTDSLNHEMQRDRQEIIDFVKDFHQPVVDSVSPLMKLLNANSYQKGSWILHMLRRQLGDSVFHSIIRNYYSAYAGKNADTRDFEKICEATCGKNLQSFFQQWLYAPGLPSLNVKWKYNDSGKEIAVTVNQLQDNLFQFPLEIQLETGSGNSKLETLNVTQKNQSFTIPVSEKVIQVRLDPNVSLLYAGSISNTN